MSVDFSGAVWRKSARSQPGNCVEVAKNLPTIVGVRDSKDPEGPALAFTHAEWAAFVKEVKRGGFNRQ
ncbi:MAG: DUF397 domain-containing protein [Streptosporangiales bacterium]|nr:DUF397 domain-containing protein [Streptosporangiales bacterium]